jgi:hypothetical protein
MDLRIGVTVFTVCGDYAGGLSGRGVGPYELTGIVLALA